MSAMTSMAGSLLPRHVLHKDWHQEIRTAPLPAWATLVENGETTYMDLPS